MIGSEIDDFLAQLDEISSDSTSVDHYQLQKQKIENKKLKSLLISMKDSTKDILSLYKSERQITINLQKKLDSSLQEFNELQRKFDEIDRTNVNQVFSLNESLNELRVQQTEEKENYVELAREYFDMLSDATCFYNYEIKKSQCRIISKTEKFLYNSLGEKFRKPKIIRSKRLEKDDDEISSVSTRASKRGVKVNSPPKTKRRKTEIWDMKSISQASSPSATVPFEDEETSDLSSEIYGAESSFSFNTFSIGNETSFSFLQSQKSPKCRCHLEKDALLVSVGTNTEEPEEILLSVPILLDDDDVVETDWTTQEKNARFSTEDFPTDDPDISAVISQQSSNNEEIVSSSSSQEIKNSPPKYSTASTNTETEFFKLPQSKSTINQGTSPEPSPSCNKSTATVHSTTTRGTSTIPVTTKSFGVQFPEFSLEKIFSETIFELPDCISPIMEISDSVEDEDEKKTVSIGTITELSNVNREIDYTMAKFKLAGENSLTSDEDSFIILGQTLFDLFLKRIRRSNKLLSDDEITRKKIWKLLKRQLLDRFSELSFDENFNASLSDNEAVEKNFERKVGKSDDFEEYAYTNEDEDFNASHDSFEMPESDTEANKKSETVEVVRENEKNLDNNMEVDGNSIESEEKSREAEEKVTENAVISTTSEEKFDSNEELMRENSKTVSECVRNFQGLKSSENDCGIAGDQNTDKIQIKHQEKLEVTEKLEDICEVGGKIEENREIIKIFKENQVKLVTNQKILKNCEKHPEIQEKPEKNNRKLKKSQRKLKKQQKFQRKLEKNQEIQGKFEGNQQDQEMAQEDEENQEILKNPEENQEILKHPKENQEIRKNPQKNQEILKNPEILEKLVENQENFEEKQPSNLKVRETSPEIQSALPTVATTKTALSPEKHPSISQETSITIPKIASSSQQTSDSIFKVPDPPETVIDYEEFEKIMNSMKEICFMPPHLLDPIRNLDDVIWGSLFDPETTDDPGNSPVSSIDVLEGFDLDHDPIEIPTEQPIVFTDLDTPKSPPHFSMATEDFSPMEIPETSVLPAKNFAGTSVLEYSQKMRLDLVQWQQKKTISKQSEKRLCKTRRAIKTYLEADWTCENLENCLSSFNPTEVNVLVEAIAETVEDNKWETEINTEFTPPAPPLPRYQQKLILLVKRLADNNPKLPHLLLEDLEDKLFRLENSSMEISDLRNVSYYYTALADLFFEGDTTMTFYFIVKCLYVFGFKAIPMIFVVIKAFPNSLPKKSQLLKKYSPGIDWENMPGQEISKAQFDFEKMDSLDLTVMYLLTCIQVYRAKAKEIKDHELFNYLPKFYGFNLSFLAELRLLNILMKRLEAGELENLSMSFIILAKRAQVEFTIRTLLKGKLIPCLQKLMAKQENFTEIEKKKVCLLVEAISAIIKPFGEDKEKIFKEIFPMIVGMLGRVQCPAIQETCIRAILRLQRFIDNHKEIFTIIKHYQETSGRFSDGLRFAIQTFIHRKNENQFKNSI